MNEDTRRMLDDVLRRHTDTRLMSDGQHVFYWSEKWSKDGRDVVVTEAEYAEMTRIHDTRPISVVPRL